jgi:hypothetical protein
MLNNADNLQDNPCPGRWLDSRSDMTAATLLAPAPVDAVNMPSVIDAVPPNKGVNTFNNPYSELTWVTGVS